MRQMLRIAAKDLKQRVRDRLKELIERQIRAEDEVDG